MRPRARPKITTSSGARTLNSVFGTKVNSLRFAMTREDYLDSSVAFKAAGYRQERLLPTLAYNNFTDQQNAKGDAVGEHTYLINDTLTWSVPNFKGSHQVQAGFEFAWTRVNNHVQDNLNGTFRFSHNLAFDAADPRTWPDQFAIRVPIESNYMDMQDYYSGVHPGQVEHRPALHGDARRALRSRDLPDQEHRQPEVPGPE